ncbi:hypothetical protein PWEIH_07881 [Listeria weihenstephanensis FSL R9-0317]|uniref:SMI1/KNR4 family protein n=1 Tax=Listeria weihenstephanensis TaxID=1006155 RepID=A0A1S7FVQ0_9LIST|nr:hypothetical protein [Listeria weihenstephanensis]AQY51493.1 hypothetical protein UE46_10920 [Listeria weihenstephanensis]EUJ39323.1 hypothetical protein PWEIH_07881 [Listeria weihenstephanensis FSL R9-0317]
MTYCIDSNIYVYPESFQKIVELNMVNFDLWYLFDAERATRRYYDLKRRYPKRDLIPFAKRDDNDDIVCFEIGKGNKIQLIHDYSSEGYEQRGEYEDFWTWVRDAVNEMIEFNREDGIE